VTQLGLVSDDLTVLREAAGAASLSAGEPLPTAVSPRQIGTVTAISGFKLSCLLLPASGDSGTSEAYAAAQIGALVKIHTPQTTCFGFIGSLTLHNPTIDASFAVAEIDLLGEFVERSVNGMVFARGVSVYPVLGAPAYAASPEDLATIYARPGAPNLAIGTLHQDRQRPAYLLSQEFLCKHSAILGTTGSGKSCAVTLILRSLLQAHPNGHVVLLDPHGEYGAAFAGMAEIITPENLQLPYWLLSLEEMVEVLCSRDPATRSREANILKDLILAAKRDFLGDAGQDAYLTVDTPVPYRIAALVHRISEAMGRLDKPDNSLPYLRLLTTIETLRKDRRYAFMFSGLTLRDNMTEILSRILRIPVEGKPITIFDISLVPSEIVDVVVSLLCRLVFDFALWSDHEEAIPVLLVCDEAHRYIHADESLGFEPTRRSIARIAKEGRKYGVSLCLVSQRPSEISETILSQCSTVFSLRMSNDKDQNFVRRVLPESAAGLLNTLPALRQQEAIVVGEGVTHPMRIRFADLEEVHRPRGESTNFPRAWQEDVASRAFAAKIVERWRRQMR
jgi:DNA helicase HerA-like ATPase